MEGSELILTTPVMPPNPLEKAIGGLAGASDKEKLSAAKQTDSKKLEQLSKDFESVLMTKLVDAMKDTVEQWDTDKEDAAGGQVQGLFWYYLAQDMAEKGGIGLWKDLYRFFSDLQKTNALSQSPDGSTLHTIDEGL